MVLPNGASPIKIRSTRYTFGSDGITLIELGSTDPDVKGVVTTHLFAASHTDLRSAPSNVEAQRRVVGLALPRIVYLMPLSRLYCST
jgi:hypothetical protein